MQEFQIRNLYLGYSPHKKHQREPEGYDMPFIIDRAGKLQQWPVGAVGKNTQPKASNDFRFTSKWRDNFI